MLRRTMDTFAGYICFPLDQPVVEAMSTLLLGQHDQDMLAFVL